MRISDWSSDVCSSDLYPRSPYLDTLATAQARLMEKVATRHSDIIIPGDYRTFEHIKDFVKQFEGKVVYLDIWGTWCGPCKEEMRHLPFIKEQLWGKDVVFLDRKSTRLNSSH